MNKSQIKILSKKILPKSILLIVIILSLVSIPIIRYFGNKMAKENEEWFSDPNNKERIDRALINYSNKVEKNETKPYQNKNVKYIKSLKIDIEGWNVTSLPIGDEDEIGLLQLTKDEDYFNIFYANVNNFDGLKEYSEYQNQRIIDNLGKLGISLKPIDRMEKIIKERYSYIEIYKSEFKGEEQPNMVIMCAQHNGYYYSISYPAESENVSKLFDNFSFVD